MSFDLYVSRFSKGDFKTFSREVVAQALGPYIASRQPQFHLWILSFPDGGKGDCYIGDGDEIDGFVINRPGGKDVYRALYEILRRTSTVMYWDSGAAVADQTVVADLPPEMVEAMGQPAVVHDGDELFDAVTAPPVWMASGKKE